MGRAPRIDYPGAWHHVGHRGIDGRVIFIDDVDRRHFCALLGEVLERFGLETHAWCLMNNHHHLLVRSASGQLSRAMQYLNAGYTQRFNWRHERSGQLLRGRFHSTRIDTDAYLAAASRYIHRNPVEAGIVGSPEQYRWSSYRGYVDAADADGWLHRDEVLGRFDGNRMRHHRFVTDAATCPIAATLERRDAPAVLDAGVIGGAPRSPGSPAARPGSGPQPATAATAPATDTGAPTSCAIDTVGAAARATDTGGAAARATDTVGAAARAVDTVVATVFGVEPASLCAGGRGKTNTARLAAVVTAHRLGHATSGEITRRYGFTSVRAAESAIRRAVTRRERDPDFAAALDQVEQRLRAIAA